MDFHLYLIGQRSETWPSLPDRKFQEVRTRSSWSLDTEAPPRADTNPRWVNTLNMHSRCDERNSRSPFWPRWENSSYAQRYMSAFNTQWGEGIAQIFLKAGDFKKFLCKSVYGAPKVWEDTIYSLLKEDSPHFSSDQCSPNSPLSLTQLLTVSSCPRLYPLL